MSDEIPTPAHPKKAAMIAALSLTGVVTKAADAAGVSRRSHQNWVRDDPEYAAAVAEAMENAADLMEVEARRRAVDGVDEPVFYKGDQCGAVRKYSDTLLIFMLKAARPEKYRERVTHRLEDPDGALARVLGVPVEELPA